MGASLSRSLATFIGKQEIHVVMVGLTSSGKSGILPRLKTDQVVQTIPTGISSFDTYEHKNVNFQVWELGGQKSRSFSAPFFQTMRAIIFVVDANDTDLIADARDELEFFLAFEELRDAPLLVFANKSDLPKCLGPNEVIERLGLRDLDRRWVVQSSSVLTGQGLHEGMDWLTSNVTGSE